MKKQNLATLAVIGVGAGLLLGGCQKHEKQTPAKNGGNGKAPAEEAGADMQAFSSSLSPEGKKKFEALDAQHKMMAVEMANQECNGKNKCAGLGGCGTPDNSCAGKNSCKGHGGPPVKDPNEAVEVQYKNQTNGNGKSE
ncbi:MAG: hypothetical protein S4CHLAM2_11710 [Chlamydiales bacterium]|nr:hypothetical protein [Chlamydiales bacterium]